MVIATRARPFRSGTSAPMPPPVNGTESPAVDEQVTHLRKATESLQADPRQQRVRLVGIKCKASADTRIMHKLGREPGNMLITWWAGGPQLLHPVFADGSFLTLRNAGVVDLTIDLEVW